MGRETAAEVVLVGGPGLLVRAAKALETADPDRSVLRGRLLIWFLSPVWRRIG